MQTIFYTSYQCYTISGKDAVNFLQGQFTIDITKLTTDTLQPAAYCTHDGKVLGFFYLTKLSDLQDGFLLCTHDDQPEVFIKRLKMFVLRSEVVIQPSEHKIIGTLQWSEQANKPSSIQEFADTLLNTAEHPQLTMRILQEPSPEDTNQINTSSADWDYIETLMGIPSVPQAIRGQIIAPFLNLDLLNAIDYQKGCYVGQELIARLYYRTQPAKRSYVYYCNNSSADFDTFTVREDYSGVSSQSDKPKNTKFTLARKACYNKQVVLMIVANQRNMPQTPLQINDCTFHHIAHRVTDNIAS